MADSVIDPQGRRWVVRRRWIPRLGTETLWGRFRRCTRGTFRRVSDGADLDPGCADAIGEGIVGAIVLIVALVVLFFVVVPLLVAIVDVLILVVLAFLAATGRVLFRRPWIVEAVSDDGTVQRFRVVGWRASKERCRQLGQRLMAGVEPDV